MTIKNQLPTIPLVDLRRQYRSIKNDIDNALRDVVESGSFIAGQSLRLFEKEFASFCGVKFAIGVASGTDALLLSLRALELEHRSEVITAPNTFISTVDAITRNDAYPRFVDINQRSYNMDSDKLSRAITRRTRVIIPVHLYGNPADMSPILEIARQSDLQVIEDACQAHGALYGGKRVGSLGTCAAFSFYPAKNLGAYGDGGMITTDNEDLATRLRILRVYGERKKYVHELVGYNSRLDEIQAAVLRVKLRHLDDWNKARRGRAKVYRDLLSTVASLQLPIEESHAEGVYHLYVIGARGRDELQLRLASKGISTGIHYPIPVHLQEAYRHLEIKSGTFPYTEAAAKRILSLPMFPELEDGEIEYISDSIKEFYRNS